MPRAPRHVLRTAVALGAVVVTLVTTAGGAASDLFVDDFSRFPPGLLSAPIGQLNGAIQEYHYISHRGVPLDPWEHVITHVDAWAAGDEEGKPYLEQHTVNALSQQMNPTLVTGDPAWRDYAVEVRVKPLSLADMAGLVFRRCGTIERVRGR